MGNGQSLITLSQPVTNLPQTIAPVSNNVPNTIPSSNLLQNRLDVRNLSQEQQIALRNMKLKQFLFDLSDRLSKRSLATFVLPTSEYLNVFGDILNKLVILTLD